MRRVGTQGNIRAAFRSGFQLQKPGPTTRWAQESSCLNHNLIAHWSAVVFLRARRSFRKRGSGGHSTVGRRSIHDYLVAWPPCLGPGRACPQVQLVRRLQPTCHLSTGAHWSLSPWGSGTSLAARLVALFDLRQYSAQLCILSSFVRPSPEFSCGCSHVEPYRAEARARRVPLVTM